MALNVSNNVMLTKLSDLEGLPVPIASGGTGAITKATGFDALSPLTTLGDTLYEGASGVGTRLAGNITAVRQVLTQTGTGAVSAAPVWYTLVKDDIGLSLVENTALSTWAGSTNVLQLGSTVSIGTSITGVTSFNVVSSSTSSNNQINIENHVNANTPAAIAYTKSRGTKASPAAVITSDFVGSFLFLACDIANTLRQVGSFGVRANGTIGNNSVPSELWFGVSPGWNSTNPFGDGTIQILCSADTTVAINSVTKGTGQFNIFNGSTTRVAAIVKGIASQTADLLQLQTSTASPVFKVGIAGDLTTYASMTYKRTATAISYAVLSTDYLIGVTNTAAARTITLPTAASVVGKTYIIKDESGGAVLFNITIACTGGQTIDGAATKLINTNYGVVCVYSDGTNWFTI